MKTLKEQLNEALRLEMIHESKLPLTMQDLFSRGSTLDSNFGKASKNISTFLKFIGDEKNINEIDKCVNKYSKKDVLALYIPLAYITYIAFTPKKELIKELENTNGYEEFGSAMLSLYNSLEIAWGFVERNIGKDANKDSIKKIELNIKNIKDFVDDIVSNSTIDDEISFNELENYCHIIYNYIRNKNYM